MNSAVMPRLAASMCTPNPSTTPASEMTPAARPWQREREIRYSMLGPGVRTSSREAPANTSRSWTGIMVGRNAQDRVFDYTRGPGRLASHRAINRGPLGGSHGDLRPAARQLVQNLL